MAEAVSADVADALLELPRESGESLLSTRVLSWNRSSPRRPPRQVLAASQLCAENTAYQCAGAMSNIRSYIMEEKDVVYVLADKVENLLEMATERFSMPASPVADAVAGIIAKLRKNREFMLASCDYVEAAAVLCKTVKGALVVEGSVKAAPVGRLSHFCGLHLRVASVGMESFEEVGRTWFMDGWNYNIGEGLMLLRGSVGAKIYDDNAMDGLQKMIGEVTDNFSDACVMLVELIKDDMPLLTLLRRLVKPTAWQHVERQAREVGDEFWGTGFDQGKGNAMVSQLYHNVARERLVQLAEAIRCHQSLCQAQATSTSPTHRCLGETRRRSSISSYACGT